MLYESCGVLFWVYCKVCKHNATCTSFKVVSRCKIFAQLEDWNIFRPMLSLFVLWNSLWCRIVDYGRIVASSIVCVFFFFIRIAHSVCCSATEITSLCIIWMLNRVFFVCMRNVLMRVLLWQGLLNETFVIQFFINVFIQFLILWFFLIDFIF